MECSSTRIVPGWMVPQKVLISTKGMDNALVMLFLDENSTRMDGSRKVPGATKGMGNAFVKVAITLCRPNRFIQCVPKMKENSYTIMYINTMYLNPCSYRMYFKGRSWGKRQQENNTFGAECNEC